MVVNGRRGGTFVGSQCVVCEEPLEHTLRGERILQLMCGHTSHEACFYEFIKEFEADTCPKCDAPIAFDTSRGGNIDFQNLNRLVQAMRKPDQYQESQAAPAHHHHHQQALPPPPSRESQQHHPRSSREHLLPEGVMVNGRRHDHHHGGQSSHGRNPSMESMVNTVNVGHNKTSTNDYAESQHNNNGRRHDYDVQSMETSVSSPRLLARNPIPPPNVTVRSEFPTVTKSKTQQSLTCLVTVEVLDSKWRLYPDDVRGPPQANRADGDERPTSPKLETRVSVQQIRASKRVSEYSSALDLAKKDLFERVENWHGLDFSRFGRLILHGSVRVGKDRQAWQDLECYLFTEMLICVKERKTPVQEDQAQEGQDRFKLKSFFTLKGSILIKKHLKQVETVADADILTLSLNVIELPAFHLAFRDRTQLDLWRTALINIDQHEAAEQSQADPNLRQARSDDGLSNGTGKDDKRPSSQYSSVNGGAHSMATAATEYSNTQAAGLEFQSSISSFHVPIDIVVVVPVSSSTQGLKITLLRETLRFLVSSLGERDRMGLVTFGSGGGGIPVVGMTSKKWPDWSKALDSIRPIGLKNMRADVVEGANVALDLLLQRKWANPLSHVLLISDATTSEAESVNFVVSRAEAAKICIHSFGLGLTHKPDTMVDLSTRTKASYTYVKDWMMLRESVAGCLGSLQSISHQNVKLKLRLPEGSPGKFVKVSGALTYTKRSSGKDAEACLGDLRFGDKRDILVQLAIQPESVNTDSLPSDHWENMISGLHALGPDDQDEGRHSSVEEMPLLQADLVWGDILREGSVAQMNRPSLLAITMLPAAPKRVSTATRPVDPPIPPHPSVVQRRMELLTSDMLSRALNLVARGQHDRAHHLLLETRSILKGLGKGGLPPLPTPPPERSLPRTPPPPPTPKPAGGGGGGGGVETVSSPTLELPLTALPPPPPTPQALMPRTPSPPRPESMQRFTPAVGIDPITMIALDTELESALEWIVHPAIFGRDSRKAVLQAIAVISSQRGFTFRTPAETLWASRIPGTRRVIGRSREWRDTDESLREE